MIYSLNGILSNLEDDFFVVKCAGIGFKCKSDSKTLSQLKNSLGEEINVFTILNIRENAWDLFGFNDKIHVECFKMLTSVTDFSSFCGKLFRVWPFFPSSCLMKFFR